MRITRVAAFAAWAALAGSAGAVGNIADVTVYDRIENRALPVHHHQGRYYVVGRPGNEYQVRVGNRTGRDILAVVSVDGVNAVSGETANWNQTGYVLGPYQGFDIKGWRKSLQRTAAFFFTEHQHSYAARTGRPENVGVIGVALYRRKAEPQVLLPRPRPWSPRAQEGEAGAARDSGSSAPAESMAREDSAQAYRHSERSNSLGTGHGRTETSHVTYTDFERATPNPEEVIVIHYDTYANLVAMGVIRAPRIAAPAPMPTPFPGQFVPDPR